MEKEFIPYKIALQLKELGFNEPCFKKYIAGCLWSSPTVPEIYENIHPNSSDCLAPTFSQAFRWFREKYKLYPEIGLHDREDEETWRFTISILGYYELAYNQDISKEAYYKTYEEAELACIKKLIEIIKENGK